MAEPEEGEGHVCVSAVAMEASASGRNFTPAVSVFNSIWNTQLSQMGCLPFLPWIAASQGLE